MSWPLSTKAIVFSKAHGITIQRVLTDAGLQLDLKHLCTRSYRPQTNGKAERFIQTVTREWA